MSADVLDIQGVADQWTQRRIVFAAMWDMEFHFTQTADARCKMEAQQVHYSLLRKLKGKYGTLGLHLR